MSSHVEMFPLVVPGQQYRLGLPVLQASPILFLASGFLLYRLPISCSLLWASCFTGFPNQVQRPPGLTRLPHEMGALAKVSRLAGFRRSLFVEGGVQFQCFGFSVQLIVC